MIVSGIPLLRGPTITFVASASAFTAAAERDLTINKPAGTLQGHLMVAVMLSDDSNTFTAPVGWTIAAADTSTAARLTIMYKLASSSEGASYFFDVSGDGRLAGSILTYSNADFDLAGSFRTSLDPLLIPSISPTSNNSVLFAVGGVADTVSTPSTPDGMTAVVTDSASPRPSYIICSQLVDSGATGIRSITVGSSTNFGAGILFALKPK